MATPEQLKARWETEDGQRRLSEVIKSAGDGADWAPILRGFPFAGEVKNGRDLRRAPLENRHLSTCSFEGADLSYAELTCSHKFLNQPMLAVQIKELRAAYRAYNESNDLPGLLRALTELRKAYAAETRPEQEHNGQTAEIAREHLRLVCFDFLSGG